MKKVFLSLFIGSMVFSIVLVNGALADSTIGANISTTGTLTVNNNSGTAVLFQRSGTNIFIFNTTNGRLGIDPGALDTKFEVGGTASATNLMISGAVQFAGNVSVAYSRFGTTTTNHANYISASNDLLVSGDAEIRGSASFGGTASVSGVFYMNDGSFRPNANSATAFRFQNTAGTTSVLTIDTTNTRVGIGTTPTTTFEVQGTSSASYFMSGGAVQFAGNAASLAYSRFGTNTTGHANYITASNDLLVSGDVEIDGSASFGGRASVATDFNVGENSTATTSVTFETKAAAKGVCLIITGANGTVYYARIVASGSTGTSPQWWLTTTNCNI
ncbi:MAG: hypothetical protein A2913_01215 [Parcubacteria group bacterium RIFCSPLOWO2_01_FULL_40_65]|nr:MAG: hypothetical protein A2734_00860 [Parcubacteria group bacterium RIFCSPHIGHO2_01_FULL_40_30]OHB19504.1 MAG: hypothetical protein A3D40_02580 [Parcubacteria group bacterium RIFCSPHIGHO2_02_FULL_40_12]OHB22107.1 MAG: hypothetical protein A2913_01215 [Parcubacteria group bacterium RIFCSPLOWO2_01_FULL_40_65]OHB23702.1 MAG: hypothetical protein A3I22_02615 [Parcubacteria group bacterium RIFCSPLOWO2_02_FULL_40_12]